MQGASRKVLVIGGGIVGLATAYALLREGASVTVLNPEGPQHRASSATAGIIGGSSVIPWASSSLWPRLPALLLKKNSPLRLSWPLPSGLGCFLRHSMRAGRDEARRASSAGLANLGLQGWDAWQDLLSDLPGVRDLFVQNGCLFYYATEAEQTADKADNALRRSFGMDLTPVTGADMQAVLPPLNRAVAAGMRVNRAGHVTDPMALLHRLRAAITDLGGQFAQDRATGLQASEGRITSVTTTRSQYTADTIVLAAGSSSAKLAAKLGLTVPMVPAWGASVTFTEPSIDLETPILLLSDGFAVTPSRQGLRVSGLVQIGGADKAEVMTKTLIWQTKRLFGDFACTDLQTFAGPRPLTADSLPILGQDPYCDNLFHNFGHGHWGLTQAAISGQATADLVLGRPTRIALDAYRPDRFQ